MVTPVSSATVKPSFTSSDYFAQKKERERIQAETRAKREEEKKQAIQTAYEKASALSKRNLVYGSDDQKAVQAARGYKSFAEKRYTPETLGKPKESQPVKETPKSIFEPTAQERAEVVAKQIAVRQAVPVLVREKYPSGLPIRQDTQIIFQQREPVKKEIYGKPNDVVKGGIGVTKDIYTSLIEKPAKGAAETYQFVQRDLQRTQGTDLSKAPKWVQSFLNYDDKTTKRDLLNEKYGKISSNQEALFGATALIAVPYLPKGKLIGNLIYKGAIISETVSDRPLFEKIGRVGTLAVLPKVTKTVFEEGKAAIEEAKWYKSNVEFRALEMSKTELKPFPRLDYTLFNKQPKVSTFKAFEGIEGETVSQRTLTGKAIPKAEVKSALYELDKYKIKFGGVIEPGQEISSLRDTSIIKGQGVKKLLPDTTYINPKYPYVTTEPANLPSLRAKAVSNIPSYSTTKTQKGLEGFGFGKWKLNIDAMLETKGIDLRKVETRVKAERVPVPKADELTGEDFTIKIVDMNKPSVKVVQQKTDLFGSVSRTETPSAAIVKFKPETMTKKPYVNELADIYSGSSYLTSLYVLPSFKKGYKTITMSRGKEREDVRELNLGTGMFTEQFGSTISKGKLRGLEKEKVFQYEGIREAQREAQMQEQKQISIQIPQQIFDIGRNQIKIPKQRTKDLFEEIKPDEVTPPIPFSFNFPEQQKGKKKKGKAYAAFLKRRGKFKRISQPLSLGGALDIGTKAAVGTLGATFKVKEVGGEPLDMRTGGEFSKYKGYFRTFKIKKGQRQPLDDMTFIQKRGTRLGSFGEVSEIQRARKVRMFG